MLKLIFILIVTCFTVNACVTSTNTDDYIDVELSDLFYLPGKHNFSSRIEKMIGSEEMSRIDSTSSRFNSWSGGKNSIVGIFYNKVLYTQGKYVIILYEVDKDCLSIAISNDSLKYYSESLNCIPKILIIEANKN